MKRARSPVRPPDSRTDGRVARGVRVHDAILRAMLDLIEKGNLAPTSPEIAAHAGVSLRALFNHFKDADSLRAAAIERQALEEAELFVAPIPADRPLEHRIRAYAEQRARFLEGITPYRRAAVAYEHFSPPVAEGLRRARERTRLQVEQVFAPELAALNPKERRKLAAMLVVAGSWPTWDTLRSPLNFSRAEAKAAVTEMLHRILESGRSP